jgi:hypothetical protein
LEAERVAGQFATDATVVDGVVRWNSNNRVPPGDILEFWHYLGKPFNINASTLARSNEQIAFLAEYRRRMDKHPIDPSGEEYAELLANFGSDATVMNVITGQTIRLAEPYTGPMVTLRCKGRELLADAAENHLVPIVFNNLSGANFDSTEDLGAYLREMSARLPSSRNPMALSIGDGPIEVLLGDRIIASCMIGGGDRITEADIAHALNYGTDQLWWIAENEAEAEKWLRDLTDKGCTLVKKETRQDDGRVDVVFRLNKARALEALGYLPEDEEWLEADDSSPRPSAPAARG